MLQLPTPPFRKRRGRTRRTPPAPAAALALVSVLVEFADGADANLVLTFDTTAEDPLGDATAAAPTKWTMRYDGITYEGSEVSNLTFNTLNLHLYGGAAEAGPNVLNYSNAPSDISDALGRQLAAFAGFAL